jgi:hypothetical protein
MQTSASACTLRVERLTEQVQAVLSAMSRPLSLEDPRHVLGSDAESNHRDDRRSDADVRLGLSACGSAHATRDDRSVDAADGPNMAEHVIEFGPQGEEAIEREAILPLRPQPLDHFWKPHAQRVAARHVARFYDGVCAVRHGSVADPPRSSVRWVARRSAFVAI